MKEAEGFFRAWQDNHVLIEGIGQGELLAHLRRIQALDIVFWLSQPQCRNRGRVACEGCRKEQFLTDDGIASPRRRDVITDPGRLHGSCFDMTIDLAQPALERLC